MQEDEIVNTIYTFKKLMVSMKPFTIVLIALFIINAFFNLYYRWEGINFIVRVYVFLYAFYIVYNIAQLNLDTQKQMYTEKYATKGIHRLFLISRVIPFAFIYFVIVIFTLIAYMGTDVQSWFTNVIIDILNGRFSNTIIYALLLLIILKIKRGPYITIPLFLISSYFYLFLFDRFIYSFFGEGLAVSLIKIIKYMVFFYFFIFEYYYKKSSFIRPLIPVTIFSALFHLFLSGILFMFYTFSAFASTPQTRSAQMLMHWGFSFPLPYMNNMIIASENYEYISALIRYSEHYNKKIIFSNDQWEKILNESNAKNSINIIKYLEKHQIYLSYDFLLNYAVRQINENNETFSLIYEFNNYFANIAQKYMDDFIEFFNSTTSSNERLWGIKIFELCKPFKAIPILIDLLTDINDEVSLRAYIVLREITGYESLHENGLRQNSIEIINGFRKFYLEHRKD